MSNLSGNDEIDSTTGYLIFLKLRTLLKKESNFLYSEDFKKIDKKFMKEHYINTACTSGVLGLSYLITKAVLSRTPEVKAGTQKVSMLTLLIVSTMSSILFNRYNSARIYEKKVPEIKKVINNSQYKAFLIQHGHGELYKHNSPPEKSLK